MFFIWRNTLIIENRKNEFHNVKKKVTVVVQIKIIRKASNQKSTPDLSPDENGPTFSGFTQLRFGRIAMGYRLRETYL